MTPQEYRMRAEGDYSRKKIAEVYEEYEKQLRSNNALDFDDLLFKTVQLFQTQKDVLEYYQEAFPLYYGRRVSGYEYSTVTDPSAGIQVP